MMKIAGDKRSKSSWEDRPAHGRSTAQAVPRDRRSGILASLCTSSAFDSHRTAQKWLLCHVFAHHPRLLFITAVK
jgi:hypothetical protein